MKTPAPQSIERRIGLRIRQVREEKQITLAQLSKLAALSKGSLSKIENGIVSSPVSTLTRLATALGVDVGVFFATEGSPQKAVLVKKDERVTAVGRASKLGHVYQALATGLPFPKAFEPYMMVIEDPNIDRKQNVFRHEGHEWLYMIKGTMDYDHDGRVYTLRPGDALFFDASYPHGPVALHNAPVHFICVISNPVR